MAMIEDPCHAMVNMRNNIYEMRRGFNPNYKKMTFESTLQKSKMWSGDFQTLVFDLNLKL